MEITVERRIYDQNVTLSQIKLNGEVFCFGLEDALRKDKIRGQTAIPDGIYKLDKRFSPKFSRFYGHEMLWVRHVPNFEYILIHPGNTTDDTSGCLLVGDRLGIVGGKLAIVSSVATYRKLYAELIPFVNQGICSIQFITI